MVDLCQLPPLPVEAEAAAQVLDRATDAVEEYVTREVLAAVVTGMVGEDAGRMDFPDEGADAADDFAGWHRRGDWVERVVVTVAPVAETPRRASCVVWETPVVADFAVRPARGMAPVVRPGVRAAPPQVGRRLPVVSDRERGAGRLSSPLVLLCSAVVSMVLLSLASIGMVKDMGSAAMPPRGTPPQRSGAGGQGVEAVASEAHPAVSSPAFAGAASRD